MGEATCQHREGETKCCQQHLQRKISTAGTNDREANIFDTNSGDKSILSALMKQKQINK